MDKLYKFIYEKGNGIRRTEFDVRHVSELGNIFIEETDKQSKMTYVPEKSLGIPYSISENKIGIIIGDDNEKEAKAAITRFIQDIKQSTYERIQEYDAVLDEINGNGTVGSAWREQLREYNNKIMEKYPDTDMTVLTFISDLMSCAAVSEESYEVIRSTFQAGYCWHFAHILKTVFGRGEVCWAAPFGHFVWVDENGVPYDAEGLNQGEQDYNIPESYMGVFIKDFKHIPGDIISNVTTDDINRMIRKYKEDMELGPKK